MWGRCAGLAGGEEVVVVRVIVLELGEDVPEALRGGQNIEALKACDKRTAAVSGVGITGKRRRIDRRGDDELGAVKEHVVVASWMACRRGLVGFARPSAAQ